MEKFNNILAQAKKVETYKHVNTDAAWLKFQQKAENKVVVPSAKVVSLNYKKTWLSIAASLLILLTASVMFWPKQKDQFKTILTLNEPMTIKLIDGSVINAEKNTSITYPVRLDDLQERKIVIKGDATFDVAYNADLPFKVYKNNLLVEVLGTKFIVEDNKDGGIDIENIEGSVKASDVNNPSSFIVLNKGDKFNFTDEGFKDLNYVEPAPVVKKVVKKKSQKKQHSLFEIYTTLYQRTDGRIDLIDGVQIEGKETVAIDLSLNVAAILSNLEKVANFEYKIHTEKNKIEIVKLSSKE